jgi:hypothetical protein
MACGRTSIAIEGVDVDVQISAVDKRIAVYLQHGTTAIVIIIVVSERR